ncbi:MAG: hypothetical protein R3F11_20630 [Verrucomicrobiales bacterium]
MNESQVQWLRWTPFSTPAIRCAIHLWCGVTLPSALQTRLTGAPFSDRRQNCILGNEIDVTFERKVGEHAAVLLKERTFGKGAARCHARASFEISIISNQTPTYETLIHRC